jgi:hypothetical protein
MFRVTVSAILLLNDASLLAKNRSSLPGVAAMSGTIASHARAGTFLKLIDLPAATKHY